MQSIELYEVTVKANGLIHTAYTMSFMSTAEVFCNPFMRVDNTDIVDEVPTCLWCVLQRMKWDLCAG